MIYKGLIKNGFVIKEEDYFSFQEDLDYHLNYEFLDDAIDHLYKDKLFIFKYVIKCNDLDIEKVIIYYPSKRKTYLLNQTEVLFFCKKYFPSYLVIEKEPEFFIFFIPFPRIISKDKHSKNYENQFDLSIGKFHSKSFENLYIDKYIGFDQFVNSDFLKNEFHLIFQKDFQSVYRLIEDYKKYLNLILLIDLKKINSNKLFTPIYFIESADLKSLIDFANEESDYVHEQIEKQAKMDFYEHKTDTFYSDVSDLNNSAFENDPDNYFNID